MTYAELHVGEFAKFLLASLAIVFAIASLFAVLGNHCHQTTSGGTFLRAIIATMAIYQFHLLSQASTRVPIIGGSDKNVYYRRECLYSRKGGKRPYGDTSSEYRNPCYNRTITAESIINGTDVELLSGQTVAGHYGYGTSSLCSSSAKSGDDDTATLAIEPYVPASRDCNRAQTSVCTLDQPCTPCELSRRDEFHHSSHGWARCQMCSIRNNYGECGFVDGVGPYCWRNGESWEVVPCGKCCTEGLPKLDGNGRCY